VLYWRLRRLLRQNEQERRVQAAGGALDQGAAAATLRRWFTEDLGETQVLLYSLSRPEAVTSSPRGATFPQG
jgi:hypothetical protein